MDGHEREDVVEYHTKTFLPKLAEYEKLMAKHILNETLIKKSCLSLRRVNVILLPNITMRAVFMQMMKLKVCGCNLKSSLFEGKVDSCL